MGTGGGFVVNRPTVFVQRSTDSGPWSRDEWDVPGFSGTGLAASVEDGTEPVYGRGADVPRLRWRLYPVGTRRGCTWRRAGPGLAWHGRTSGGHLVQYWSDDGGVTWSQPLNTNVWTPSSPPYLIKLRDGRILLSHGYRRDPMGIRAVLSEDGGRTWDVDNTVVLRDDGGYVSELRAEGGAGSDVGYPHSTQLSDGSVLTVYYITPADRVTHIASTRWDP